MNAARAPDDDDDDVDRNRAIFATQNERVRDSVWKINCGHAERNLLPYVVGN